MYRPCWVPLLIAGFIGVGWSFWPGASVGQRLAPESLPVPKPLAGYRGAASCAAAACHGGSGPAGSRGCEYTSWMGQDRHARAYQVLLDNRSRTIARNYFRKEVRPEREMACLRCHSLDASAVLAGQRVAFEDGVGCERCHGPAERWLAVHYGLDWKQKSAADKQALGLWPTKDLRRRAQLCVDCHVGSPGNEVDHDLIAAGHPRLNFELSSFQSILPPHWNVRAERARHPDLEARLWAIGQVASAEAALELLAFRSDPANRKPWPEFAAYDCQACHRDLRAARRPGRPLGTLPFSDWYYAMPRALSFAGSPLAVPGLADDLRELSAEMAKPLPDRQKVADQARAAAGRLGPRLAVLDRAKTYDAASVHNLFDRLLRQNQPPDCWDRETQRFLALGALYHAMTDLDPGLRSAPLRNRLRSMAKKLATEDTESIEKARRGEEK